MNLIAVKVVKYAGVTHRPGDRFRTTAEHGRMLKGFGKAIDAPPATGKLTQQAMEPETESRDPPAQPRTRRQYRRRDMTAEG